jgi:chlorophyll synthase
MEESTSPIKLLEYLFKLALPQFWVVAVFPVYVGYILASRDLLPSLELILCLFIMGPLIMGSTLMLNEYSDRDIDRRNPRKASSPLIRGLIEPRLALQASIALMLSGIFLSLLLGLEFFLMVGACIILSIFYSLPPLKVKSKGGADLFINAGGLGILCPLAGYSIALPVESFPFIYLIISFSGLAAAYIPTTIVDYTTDKECGLSTISVALGEKNAFFLGLIFISIANFGVILLGIMNIHPFSQGLIERIWLLCVSTVFLYAFLLRKLTLSTFWTSFAMICLIIGIENALWLLWYAGYWII